MSPATLLRPAWKLRSPDPGLVRALSLAHGISDVASSLLVTRGITEPELAGDHLEPRLSALHDPSLLPDMAAATARIARAIERRRDDPRARRLRRRRRHRHGAARARSSSCSARASRWHIPNRFDRRLLVRRALDRARARRGRDARDQRRQRHVRARGDRRARASAASTRSSPTTTSRRDGRAAARRSRS